MIRSAPRSRHPATAPRPTIPAPNTTHVEPGCTSAVNIAAPSPVESPHANRHARSSGASRADLRQGDLRYDGVVRERGGAHEVADRLAAAGQSRGAVREVAPVLLLADGQAQVCARVQAVHALPALGREQRDDVVAGCDRAHPLADGLHDTRALVPEHRSVRIPTDRPRRPCTCRCDTRRRRRA